MSDGNSLKTESFNNTNSNKYPGFSFLFYCSFLNLDKDFPYNDESSLKKENIEKIETE